MMGLQNQNQQILRNMLPQHVADYFIGKQNPVCNFYEIQLYYTYVIQIYLFINIYYLTLPSNYISFSSTCIYKYDIIGKLKFIDRI